MKRRGFLKGLAAVLAVAPVVDKVVDAAPAAPSPTPPPEAYRSGYAMKRWIEEHPGVVPADVAIVATELDDEEIDRLLDRLATAPAVQDALMRRILERPPFLRLQPTIRTTDSANVEALDWHPGEQYIYPDTPMEIITPPQFSPVIDGHLEMDRDTLDLILKSLLWGPDG